MQTEAVTPDISIRPEPDTVPARSGIRWGDVAAITAVLAASVLFVVLFAVVPILGAPD